LSIAITLKTPEASVVCDTPEEAIRFLQLVAGQDVNSARFVIAEDEKPTAYVFSEEPSSLGFDSTEPQTLDFTLDLKVDAEGELAVIPPEEARSALEAAIAQRIARSRKPAGAELDEKILRAFANDPATPLFGLASRLFGSAAGNGVRRVRLLIENLIQRGQLERVNATTFRVLGEVPSC
jgi:hypothetical protein